MQRFNKISQNKLFTQLIEVLYKSLEQFLFKVMVIHVFHGYSSGLPSLNWWIDCVGF